MNPVSEGKAGELPQEASAGSWWPRGLLLAGAVVVIWNVIFATIAIRTASPVVDSYKSEHR